MIKRIVFFALISVSMIFVSCNILSTGVNDDWLIESVDNSGLVSASRSIAYGDTIYEVNLLATEHAIQDVLDGSIGAYLDFPNGDRLVFAEMVNEITEVVEGVDRVLSFSIISSEAVSRKSAPVTGGPLNTGGSFSIELYAGFGVNAWAEESTGNIDLELWRRASGNWPMVDSSYGVAGSTESVRSGTWWSTYRFKFLAAANNTVFVGNINY